MVDSMFTGTLIIHDDGKITLQVYGLSDPAFLALPYPEQKEPERLIKQVTIGNITTLISLKFLAHSQISVLENAVKIGVS